MKTEVKKGDCIHVLIPEGYVMPPDMYGMHGFTASQTYEEYLFVTEDGIIDDTQKYQVIRLTENTDGEPDLSYQRFSHCFCTKISEQEYRDYLILKNL